MICGVGGIGSDDGGSTRASGNVYVFTHNTS